MFVFLVLVGIFFYIWYWNDLFGCVIGVVCLIGFLVFFLFVGEFNLICWDFFIMFWSLCLIDFILFGIFVWLICFVRVVYIVILIVVFVFGVVVVFFLVDYMVIVFIMLIVGLVMGYCGMVGFGVVVLVWILWWFYYDL